jgi:hypothetical protein
MLWDEAKVLANIQAAQTDDLLDRVTAYRTGMEPSALAMIEKELYRRGVTASEIASRREQCERECIFDADGSATRCSYCHKPAVSERWSWFRLLRGWVPIVPRWVRTCKIHSQS